ncbi:MAG: hypothetical protein JNL25_08355 [Rhodospirillaceae bacterium]|nr:hypothetical protein [Rhodospirillaceae bacterium]
MMRLALALLLFLASCGGAPKVNPSESGPCGALEVDACVSFLDDRGVTKEARNDALIAAGEARMKLDAPEHAIPFYDAILDRDQKNVVAHEKSAAALVALAENFGSTYNEIDTIFARGYYVLAGKEYVKAIEIDPTRQENYLAAVTAFLKGNDNRCHRSRLVRADHEERFGSTDDQIKMVELIKKECLML